MKHVCLIAIVFFGVICFSFRGDSNRIKNDLISPLIKVEKNTFTIDEAIPISYSIKNISTDTIAIWHCGFWCNNKIVVTDINNHEIELSVKGKSVRLAFTPGGERNKNAPFRVAPEAVDNAYEKYDVTILYEMNKKGTYYVQYFYHEIDGEIEVKGQSNKLKIIVE